MFEKTESEEIDMMLEVIEKGYERQKNIGIKQGILETARKMLRRNMKIDEIQEITGLTKKEIEKL